MSFNVCYVENDPIDFQDIEKAMEEFNSKFSIRPFSIVRARDPDEMKGILNIDLDIILADVFYDDPITGLHDYNRLNDILLYVKEWGDKENGGRSIPVIAYSGVASLEECLKRKNALYDIWDKNTLTPEYVIWRLSKLALEVSRIQPDSCLLRLIRRMETGAMWHKKVVQMAKNYNAGWTEYDQITRAGEAIESIASKLKVWEKCNPMWELMTKWEALGRATSREVRGHARHVINVFWLGYYLLHNTLLSNQFVKCWQDLLINRSNMGAVKAEPPLEALSCVWFYAGLFHDIGACIEKAYIVETYHSEILSTFGALADLVKYLRTAVCWS